MYVSIGITLLVLAVALGGTVVLRQSDPTDPAVARDDPAEPADRGADVPGSSATSPGSDASGTPTGENVGGAAAHPSAAEPDLAVSTLYHRNRRVRALPPEWPIVRGVYSTMWSFAGQRWNELMDLVRTTEINAIVIDVKDDDGLVAWNGSEVAVARETGADGHTTLTRSAAEARIRELREAGGYPIARIVCFKDAVAAPAKPELAIRTADGGVWRDRKGMAWLDANKQGSWDYLVDLGREAASMGFLEVQFDYVRFPTDGNTASAVYDDGRGVDPSSIRDFLAYAREELHAEGVRVSADIFGLTTYKAAGEGDGDGTGQLFEDIISEVDYVSPMVYPSHYYPGNYGLSHPESQPYEVVVNAMREAQARVHGYRAQVRPWLEDFSLTVSHHPGRVTAQMRATYENGIESWLLWNAHNRYSREALGPEETPKAAPAAAPPDQPADAAPDPGGQGS